MHRLEDIVSGVTIMRMFRALILLSVLFFDKYSSLLTIVVDELGAKYCLA